MQESSRAASDIARNPRFSSGMPCSVCDEEAQMRMWDGSCAREGLQLVKGKKVDN